jgi:AraC-like DNA-binding protein
VRVTGAAHAAGVIEGFRVEHLHLASGASSLEGFALVLAEGGEPRAHLPGGEAPSLVEGDLLVLGPGQVGRVSARRASAQVLVLRAGGAWLARALTLAGLEASPATPPTGALRAGTPEARRAAQRLRELAQPDREPGPAARLRRAAGALELIAAAAAARPEAYAQPPRRRSSQRRAALGRALARLADEPLHGVSLSRFADGLGLSVRQASRLVRDRLGSSFGEHVSELRLARARSLLADSELSVIDVAAEAGFGSLGHFNQLFRARSGATPSAFRRAMRARAEGAPGALVQAPGGGATRPEGAAALRAAASARSSWTTMESAPR